MSITADDVKTALSKLVDPNTGKDFVSSKSVKNIQVDGADIAFDLELGYPAKSQVASLRAAVLNVVKAIPGVGNVSVSVQTKIHAHAV